VGRTEADGDEERLVLVNEFELSAIGQGRAVFRIPPAVLGRHEAQEVGPKESLVLGQNISVSVPEEANNDEESLLVDANDHGRTANESASESPDDGANASFDSLQVNEDTQKEFDIFGDACRKST